MATPQYYPRIPDKEDRFHGFLDIDQLVPHKSKIEAEQLRGIITAAVVSANKKSSRAILEIKEDVSDEELADTLLKKGSELFKYFVKYCGDPASSAHDCVGKHYSDIARDQFRNRSLQKERMNSGWRYQFIVRDAALASGRFRSLSDIGSAEADFNATIDLVDGTDAVTIYISVKNRADTLGGQDWPKSIRALEQVAAGDKNRTSPYICVFGIAMERGQRQMKRELRTGQFYSVNTEVWLSDFFWPFFTNYSYQEVIREMVLALNDSPNKPEQREFLEIPNQLIESFGAECQKFGLLDSGGRFNDPYKLADLFVMGVKSFFKEYAAA